MPIATGNQLLDEKAMLVFPAPGSFSSRKRNG
jgi:hypothetical protein